MVERERPEEDHPGPDQRDESYSESDREPGDHKLPEHDGGRQIPERGPARGRDPETGREQSDRIPEHEGGKGVPERGTGGRAGTGSGRGTDPGREVGSRRKIPGGKGPSPGSR
jgi:hypothetical protein